MITWRDISWDLTEEQEPAPAPDVEPQSFLQVSRNTMYELLRTNAIRSKKYGKLIRIPKSALLGDETP